VPADTHMELGLADSCIQKQAPHPSHDFQQTKPSRWGTAFDVECV
jgi:hypothetical protein